MELLLLATDKIAQKIQDCGYDYCNIRNGRIGVDFKTGLTAYLEDAKRMNLEPVFPILVGSGVKATNPGSPLSWATFTIVQDTDTGLRIDAMKISMYECHDGPLRASLNVAIKSLEDIPSRREAGKLIEAEWQKKRMENISKWQKPDLSNTGQSRRRKL